jgi:hypothetical protein
MMLRLWRSALSADVITYFGVAIMREERLGCH